MTLDDKLKELEEKVIGRVGEERVQRAYQKMKEFPRGNGLGEKFKKEWLSRMALDYSSRTAGAGLSVWTEYIEPYDVLDDMYILHEFENDWKKPLSWKITNFMDIIFGTKRDVLNVVHYEAEEIRKQKGISSNTLRY